MNGTAFKEGTNGRERTTDGLWTHRGVLSVRDQTGEVLTSGYGGTTIRTTRQLNISMDPPAISPNAFVDGHIQLQTSAPGYAPRIGFHESGSTGVAIYKKVGVNELRVMTNQGEDYPLVGKAGSVHALLFETVFVGDAVPLVMNGGWQIIPSFTTPSLACTGASVLAEYGVTFTNPAAGNTQYIGPGQDNAIIAHYGHYTAPAAGQPMTHTATHRYVPAAGNHIFNLMVLGSGTFSVWNGGYQYFRLWEIRA